MNTIKEYNNVHVGVLCILLSSSGNFDVIILKCGSFTIKCKNTFPSKNSGDCIGNKAEM